MYRKCQIVGDVSGPFFREMTMSAHVNPATTKTTMNMK